jgi:hypothetical protein
MRVDLAGDEAVIGIAGKLGMEEDHVVGKLHRLWSWAHSHLRNGNAPNVTPAWVDRHVGVPGFAEAMQSVGWLKEVEGGIKIPKFERFNGKCQKRRAQTAERMRRLRERDAASVTKSVTEASHDPPNSNSNRTSAAVLINNNSSRPAPPLSDRELLKQEGFDPETVQELCTLASAGLIKRVIRNADHLAGGGKLKNRKGYLRRAIELRYELLPALAMRDGSEERRRRRLEREVADRQRVETEEVERVAQQARVEGELRAMPRDELAEMVEDVLNRTTPFNRRIIGECRDPFVDSALRALVWGELQRRQSELVGVSEVSPLSETVDK